MSAAEIDAAVRSAEWHRIRGAEQFKIQLLQTIMDEIDKLDEEDAGEHLRLGKVFDFINNAPVKIEI